MVTAVTAKEFSSEELASVSSHGLGPFQRGPGRFFGAAQYDLNDVQPVVVPYPAIITSDNEYYVNFSSRRPPHLAIQRPEASIFQSKNDTETDFRFQRKMILKWQLRMSGLRPFSCLSGGTPEGWVLVFG